MLGTITPLGERGRNRKWGVTISFYLVGSVLGGAALGSAVGALASLTYGAISNTNKISMLVLALVLLVGLAFDLRVFGLHLPTTHRQVHQRWTYLYREWVYGLGFGLQLGAGVFTVVTSSATYTTVVAAFLSGTWARGLVVGAAFGLVRGLTAFSVAGVRTFESFGKIQSTVDSWYQPTRLAAIAIEIVIASVLGAALVF